METHPSIWLTILGYMALTFTISFFIQRWIRSHLQKKSEFKQPPTKPNAD